MDAIITVLQVVTIAAIPWATWYIKTYIGKAAEETAAIRAKIANLPDLERIEASLAKLRSDIELEMQRRLGFTQTMLVQKLDIYNQLVEFGFELHRLIYQIPNGREQVQEFAERQQAYHDFVNRRAILMGRNVRRAATLMVAVTTEAGGDRATPDLHAIGERTRVIRDLLCTEVSIELSNQDFFIDIPSRDEIDQWNAESHRNRAEALKRELVDRQQAIQAMRKQVQRE